MTNIPQIRLNDGHSIPQLGFGVWQVPSAETAKAVSEALEAGYRLIDTAQGYDNEEGVGEAIKSSGLGRDDLFITTKLRNGAHERSAAMSAVEGSLKKLKLDYVDLLLIHWPVPKQDKYVEAWEALLTLQEQGKVRSVGVSNFLPSHLDRIVEATGKRPVLNQLELHPKYQQRDVRQYHDQHDIKIECYSPLGSGEVLSDETIKQIAAKHDRSVAQVILRWLLDQDLIVIPKSTHKERIIENFDVFGFSLDDDDRRALDGLDDPQNGKTGGQPETMNNLF